VIQLFNFPVGENGNTVHPGLLWKWAPRVCACLHVVLRSLLSE